MPAGSWLTALVALIAICAPPAAQAATYAARVRWQPSASDGVTGYRISVRMLGGETSSVDAQDPLRAPDGTLSVVVDRLDDTRSYGFTIAAHRADGTESPLSNEVLVPARTPTCGCPDPGPCRLTSCDPSLGTCGSTALADGSPCANDDPCEAGTCEGGVCLSARSAGHDLGVRGFMLRPGRRGPALIARGTMGLASDVDPRTTDLLLVVRAADGREVWRALVPAGALRGRSSGKTFRFQASRRTPAPLTASGLVRVVLRSRGGLAEVYVVASAPALRDAVIESRMEWMVQLGAACARNVTLYCTRGSARTACF